LITSRATVPRRHIEGRPVEQFSDLARGVRCLDRRPRRQTPECAFAIQQARGVGEKIREHAAEDAAEFRHRRSWPPRAHLRLGFD
jgi:hypothetical protein